LIAKDNTHTNHYSGEQIDQWNRQVSICRLGRCRREDRGCWPFRRAACFVLICFDQSVRLGEISVSILCLVFVGVVKGGGSHRSECQRGL
jgi:hypothetical protein